MTAETTARRPLTAYESRFMNAGVGPAAFSLTLHGEVDTAVMDQATRLLKRDYPLLRCAVQHNDDARASRFHDRPVLSQRCGSLTEVRRL